MSWTNTRIAMSGALAAPAIAQIFKAIAIDGDEALIVGGAVRNALIGRDVNDIDIATTALPDLVISRVTSAGLKAVPTGIEHGTITVVVDGRGYEVTTLRRDIDTDGRRARVEFGRDFAADAQRRDFTINGLYANLDGTIYDPVDGLRDIASRRVRFIGDPETRIREDYLRILRFFRFFGDYDEGDADLKALAAIEKTLDGLQTLSRERVRAEFLKILSVRRAAETIILLDQFAVLPLILEQASKPDVFVRALTLLPDLPPVGRLAALIDSETCDVAALHHHLRLSNSEARQLSGIIEALQLFDRLIHPRDLTSLRAVSFRSGKRSALVALTILAAREGRLIEKQDIDAINNAPQTSPFTGEMMLSLGMSAGPDIGRAIKQAEDFWIEANLPADETIIYEMARRAVMVN